MFSCSGDAGFEENDDLIFLNSVCVFSVYQSLCLMCLHPVFLYKPMCFTNKPGEHISRKCSHVLSVRRAELE